uniref:Chitin binding beak protein 1 n=1 Tax=Dosidicus gigas TaxID=346249 RepID=A0A0G2UHG6_DOSGI|nr:chitin binding beak protein 1 [Dosidicus gigas]
MGTNGLPNVGLILFLWGLTFCVAFGQSFDICAGGLTGVFEDKTDCRNFLFCLSGRLKHFRCHNNKVFSTKTKTCVTLNEAAGQCSTDFSRKVHEIVNPYSYCQLHPTAVLPHPDSCALFYNCSRPTSLGKYFSPYVDECPYPELFSKTTKRCEPYRTVHCERRPEPRDVCQYRQNWCGQSHCVPCHIRFPSCRGKSEGLNSVPYVKWGPQYIECRHGRLITKSKCIGKPGQPAVFSPQSRSCISVFSVSNPPTNPISCRYKSDGFYANPTNCKKYFQCLNQNFIDMLECPENLVFDSRAASCVRPSNSCPPCGTKIGC